MDNTHGKFYGYIGKMITYLSSPNEYWVFDPNNCFPEQMRKYKIIIMNEIIFPEKVVIYFNARYQSISSSSFFFGKCDRLRAVKI